MPKFLSFNPSMEGHFTKHDAVATRDVDLALDPALRFTWVLWEQIAHDTMDKGANYSDATHKVAQMSTVKQFWSYWNHLPQPSELLENKKFVQENERNENGQPNVVEALMIFKEGIKPEWEDAINTHGGHFPFSLKSNLGGAQVDEYWNNLVLGIVGSTIEPAHMITGIRLVDKLNAQRAPSIRIEVWFSDYDDTANVTLLQRNIEKCMCTKLDGTVLPPVWGKSVEKKCHQSGKK